MFDVFALSMAMSAGQASGTPSLAPPPALPPYVAIPQSAPQTSGPARINPMPSQRSVISVDPMPTSSPFLAIQPTTMPMPTDPKDVKKENGKNGEEKKDEEKKDDEKKDEEKKDDKPDDRGIFMKMLDGTAMGDKMKEKRLSVSGWTEMSYTGSGAYRVNLPVVWNDRANSFLLQQSWLRVEKQLDTDSKEASWGWRVDGIIGTDYRYMMIRGLFNQQLKSAKLDPNEPGGFHQNLYGFDLPQFYVNTFLPNLFEGTEVRLGRFETPWGMESVEGTSTPLLSRSYAFNWSPPFFHTGIAVLPKFNKNWSAFASLVLGNDTFIDTSDELRFVGNIQWKSDDEKTNATFAMSLGRGKFNAGDPFNPATNGLMSEGAGRNNFNAFDLVVSHKCTDKFTYSFEAIYAYQTGVPTTAAVGALTAANVDNRLVSGNANWASLAQYFQYQWTDTLASILRAEVFDDFQGQRTGYKGAYYAATYGFQYKPYSWLWIRPEIRYDYNGYSKPFEFTAGANSGTSHHLWTAATDIIIRW